jgi:hypothetical protein
MRESQPDAVLMPVPYAVRLVLLITALGTVYFGLFPNRLMAFAQQPGLLGR